MKQILLLLLAVACVGTTEPLPLEGPYALVTLNDGALPQAIASVPPEVTQMTGGWLLLRADGTVTDSSFWRVVTSLPSGESSVVEHRDGLAGTWTRDGDTIRIAVPGRDEYRLTLHADGSLTRFFPRHDELGGPYLDVTYRYTRLAGAP